MFLLSIMDMKQRRPSVPTSEIKAVTNPYRQSAATSKKSACYYDDSLELSDCSLNYNHDDEEASRGNNNSAALHYAIKTLTLLMIGFAGGMLYHLTLANSSAGRYLLATSPMDMPEESSLMADELVKKLATENQFHEQEITKLKEQVHVQAMQFDMVRRMEDRHSPLLDGDEESTERSSQTKEEEDEQQQQQQPKEEEEHRHPNVRPENEARILGRVNPDTGLFELYDHVEHVYKPVSRTRALRIGKGNQENGAEQKENDDRRSL